MMTDNERTARAFIEALVSEGFDTAVARYGTGEVSFWSAGAGEVAPLLMRFGEIMRRHVDEDGVSMTIHAVTADGDRVALETESHARRKDGAVYNNFYHFLVILENGKVKRIKEYHDTAHAVLLWGDLFAKELA